MYIYWGFPASLLGPAAFFILRHFFFLLLSLMVISSFFRLLGSFLIYFFPGFSCSSWYRKEVSFWAYLEGDIVSVTLFRFLGGFGYDCFWTRDTGFVF